MVTIRKLLRQQTQDMTLGELRQLLLQTTEELNDYVNLYSKEYKRSSQLQSRIDSLKQAQRNAHLEFRGIVE